MRLEFISSESPELNADEYLNRDLKENVNAKKSPGTVAELKVNVISFIRSLQKQAESVKKYFLGSHICDGA